MPHNKIILQFTLRSSHQNYPQESIRYWPIGISKVFVRLCWSTWTPDNYSVLQVPSRSIVFVCSFCNNWRPSFAGQHEIFVSTALYRFHCRPIWNSQRLHWRNTKPTFHNVKQGQSSPGSYPGLQQDNHMILERVTASCIQLVKPEQFSLSPEALNMRYYPSSPVV